MFEYVEVMRYIFLSTINLIHSGFVIKVLLCKWICFNKSKWFQSELTGMSAKVAARLVCCHFRRCFLRTTNTPWAVLCQETWILLIRYCRTTKHSKGVLFFLKNVYELLVVPNLKYVVWKEKIVIHFSGQIFFFPVSHLPYPHGSATTQHRAGGVKCSGFRFCCLFFLFYWCRL